MIATLRYVLLTAVKDRLFGVLFLLVLAALLLAAFLGDAALAEGRALSLAYAGASGRAILVLGLVVFIAFHVRRLQETREIEAILARPLSREAFVLGYAGGFAAVAVLLVVPVVAGVGLALSPPAAGLAAWGASLLLESLLVVALALFCALTLTSAVAATLAALGFYVLGRMMAFFADIAEKGVGGAGDLGALTPLAEAVVTALFMLMPRLDLFAPGAWLVHGADWSAAAPVAAQALIYVPLLLLAAMIDLRRKRF